MRAVQVTATHRPGTDGKPIARGMSITGGRGGGGDARDQGDGVVLGAAKVVELVLVCHALEAAALQHTRVRRPPLNAHSPCCRFVLWSQIAGNF